MTTNNSTAQTAPITAEQPTNKVFELVDYLKQNEQNIIRWEAHRKKYKSLNDKASRLNPNRDFFADDTEYKAIIKEKETFEKTEKHKEFTTGTANFIDGITNLGFILDNRNHYFDCFISIFDNWKQSVTDRAVARDMFLKCKANYFSLPHNDIKELSTHLYSKPFFDDFIDVLSGASGLKGLFEKNNITKYTGIAKDLEPYLSGATDYVIESIIDYKALPYEAEQPQWKFKTDGWRFIKYLGWKISDKNIQNLFKDKIDDNNKPDAGTHDKIKPILQKYNILGAKK